VTNPTPGPTTPGSPGPGAPVDAPFIGVPARIGSEIKRWREERGLSQAQLAARVGVNPSVMSRHESGEVPDPRASFLHRVADALDIPVWALLQAAGPARGPDPRALLRELALMMHERLPAALTRMPLSASTTAAPLRRAPREPLTFWVYAAQPGEEGHSFCVVDVVGDGFAPLVRDGDDVVVDERATPRLGDLVLVRGRGVLFIRRVVGARRGRPIVADPDGVPEKLGPQRVVVGVVVERRQRVERGTIPLAELGGGYVPDAVADAVADPEALVATG
jgi:transcriptional regulator with XRE-family HTH domain